MIEDHLIERKGLKEGRVESNVDSRIIHQVEFIIWINQTLSFQVSIKNGSLERGHFSLLRGLAAHGWVNRAPTWKANMEVMNSRDI
jgi:hypothetical protein